MKLIDLVDYLLHPERLPELYLAHGYTGVDPDLLSFYSENTLSLKSNVYIFSDEETDAWSVYEKEGKRYIYLFGAEEAIENMDMLGLIDKGYSNVQIAQRLLDYCKHDA